MKSAVLVSTLILCACQLAVRNFECPSHVIRMRYDVLASALILCACACQLAIPKSLDCPSHLYCPSCLLLKICTSCSLILPGLVWCTHIKKAHLSPYACTLHTSDWGRMAMVGELLWLESYGFLHMTVIHTRLRAAWHAFR